MTRAERMTATLSRVFVPSHLDIVDESGKHRGHAGARPEGETHYRIIIHSAAFSGKSRVETHRMVNEALRTEFDMGLHALSIEARAS